jgi:ankyrin repeat protein
MLIMYRPLDLYLGISSHLLILKEGQTALIQASQMNHSEIVSMLIHLGADMNHQNEVLGTPSCLLHLSVSLCISHKLFSLPERPHSSHGLL